MHINIRWRLESEYEFLFPKPEVPWKDKAMQMLYEEMKNMEFESSEDRDTAYFGIGIACFLNAESDMRKEHPDKVREWEEKVREWEYNKESWIDSKYNW